MERQSKSIEVFAPAKVNLFLHVLGKREDGYHNLHTWMQKLDFGDTVTLTVVDKAGIDFSCDDSSLPTGLDNLAVRAAHSFLTRSTNLKGCGLQIHLKKITPVAAGLGGGSSDAGAVLRGLNQLSGTEFDEKALVNMARPLGADVPFFAIEEKSVIAGGIGDEMYPVDSLNNCTLVLVNPDFFVSTKWVFDNLSLTSEKNNSKVSRFQKRNLARLTVGDMHNDLERVTAVAHPEIERMKESLLEHGASKALMSGSGPTVFGIFPDLRESISSDFQDIANALSKQYGNKVYISRV